MFQISKKTMISGALSNLFETYDYTLWFVFSLYLSNEFFPGHSKIADFFFIIFASYILRPLGSAIGGILSDQLGRKKILTGSVILMGFCSFLVSILPSYKAIGISSLLILFLIRVAQVISLGAEQASSISFLIESCEKSRRGFFCSWIAFGANAGRLLSSLVGAILFYLIDIEYLPVWGWRLAFFSSFMVFVFGFWMRKSVPESFEFIKENSAKGKRSLREIFNQACTTIKREICKSVALFAVVCFGTSATILIFTYAPIHMTKANHLVDYQSFLINSISLAILILLIPFFGSLSDKIGRMKCLSIAIGLLSLIITPYFIAITTGSFEQILLLHVVVGILCSCVFSIAPTFIAEMFPVSIRCTSVGTLYAVASCLGGGLTPLLAIKFFNNFGSYAIGFILIGYGLLSLTMFFIVTKADSRRRLTLV